MGEHGSPQKCWEAAGKPVYSFGTAHDWDPANPLATATGPDNLAMHLSAARPVPDDGCQECVWLPLCAGGCPHRRPLGGRQCTTLEDGPDRYVLALRARMGKGKNGGVAPGGE